MPSPCETTRHEVLALFAPGTEVLPGTALPADVRAHLEGCAACRAVVERAGRIVGVLGGLAARPAPDLLAGRVGVELDEGDLGRELRTLRALTLLSDPAPDGPPSELAGAVVSSLHAGHRQDRASSAMRRLARVEAPAELDERVAAEMPEGSEAPAVLARLVEEELRDPARAMSRRFSGRLERLRAPQDLEGRVGTIQSGARQRGWRVGRAAGVLAVAASTVFLVWLGPGLLRAPAGPGATRPLSFQVHRATSIDELGPTARALAGGFGGVTDLPGGSRRSSGGSQGSSGRRSR